MEHLASKLSRQKALNLLIDGFKEKISQRGIILPKFVKVVEVGPRDGLQNEKTIVTTPDKIDLINRLSDTGLKVVEVTSFVSPKWVPQMADNENVYNGIKKLESVGYPVLVPNKMGMEKALKCGVKEIAIFTAASEGFTMKNINSTIDKSIENFKEVISEAKKNNILIRGYISCVMGCPYEGDVNPEKVNEVAEKLYDLGCYEISLGDTIGVGSPEKTQLMIDAIKRIPKSKLAVHFHDTFDKAIGNILVALENGISIIDSSVGGLGGCPYAKTKAGNVCTENVVYTLTKLGIEHGVDLDKLKEVGNFITEKLGRDNMSLI